MEELLLRLRQRVAKVVLRQREVDGGLEVFEDQRGKVQGGLELALGELLAGVTERAPSA